MKNAKHYIGIDVGSTTVKAVVMEADSGRIIWKDYQRHETKQAEKVLSFLKRIKKVFPNVRNDEMRVFMTGSGAMNISHLIGARFVQEVTAVCLAAENLFPEVGTIIDLGGQDSKIIVFKDNPATGRKNKLPSMNDKCAGGTGAYLDKINAKLGIPTEELAQLQYDGLKIHHVAGKCGVFAETDINSLQKQGIPREELMASLFEAIILQNLTVLARGHTLRPLVLLLGGPNTYIEGIQQAWKKHISDIWVEREIQIPPDKSVDELIISPDNGLYFAAIGAVVFGKEEEEDTGLYSGWKELEYYINFGRVKEKSAGEEGLIESEEELNEFYRKYKTNEFIPARFEQGEKVRGFIGLDAGSTSTKAVLIDENKNILLKSYQLSKANPIKDTQEVLRSLYDSVISDGASLEVLGLVTTGYAKDVLKDVLFADGAIVETVAHTNSALHYYDDVDVICDIGGQDIKIIMLKDGQVKDFELNTQCSAGNGYFLQSTANDFGVPVENYAEIAFTAKNCPSFAYGCAVFLQSDIVNFQRQGWKKEEILAGLVRVLPKNVWLYVAQIPNFAKLGSKFVLQGGTQRNLAAVKAQVDFIESRFRDKPVQPEIIVHKHCGESGAIGAAIEAARLFEESNRKTSFIGMEETFNITYKATTNKSTRCDFCKNKCLRTFIDLEIQESQALQSLKTNPQEASVNAVNRRIIVGYQCEKGAVEEVEDMRAIQKGMDEVLKETPNLIDVTLENIFKSRNPDKIYERFHGHKVSGDIIKNRKKIKIGIPRVLLLYSLAPLFSGYFESLGIGKSNIIFSDYTSEQLFKEGGKRGVIDPCYPSKVTLSHVHNLLFKKHKKHKLNMIFYPMIGDLKTEIKNTVGCWICPSIVPSAESAKAAFMKEKDLFKERKVQFVNPFLNLADHDLFELQMYDTFKDTLGLSPEENKQAIKEGFRVLNEFKEEMRSKSKKVIADLKKNKRIGVVLLGRPYHKDPGINHEIFTEFQKLGYPVLAQDILPTDPETLQEVFGQDLQMGIIQDPMEISDIWKRSLSSNVNIKLWAAKFVARHPNLVALELSNFKCGHDAPTYNVIQEIIERSGTPFFSMKDIDENKPKGSIKLRIETMHYFLKRYRKEIFEPKEEPHPIET